MSKKINKGRLFRNIVLLLLVAGCVGFYLSNRYVKTKGFENIGDFISTYNSNKKLAGDATPETIQLLISDADYQFLENKRQQSLDRGIQVNKGDNYVDCKVVHNGDTLKGEVRLKGHMTDHLEGDKWSFRVKTKDEMMGMYRFSLQNPATRNYAYEWVYHQLLKNEDVIHLKYDFVSLKLNDKDLGIYAIEEHFGQHILRDNDRPPGAIIRWNPGLYWEHRLDELDGVYLDEAYSDYSSSFPEAYDRGKVADDTELSETYLKGATMLEAFRRGEKSTSEVFDIDKMARFHAVIDLVGGYHSLDWSDVKFYYNSETGKIEPVGYESFSVRETIKIAGQRTPEDYATVGFNYHDRLFADREFFKLYIEHLQRICDEDYFGAFAEKIKPELDQKRGVLAQEFAYIKFSFQPYYDNIELIRHNIELPKPFHAFLQSSSDSTVSISITPVSDYPIDILSLMIDGKKEFGLDSLFTLPPKARNTYAHYFNLSFNHDAKKVKNLTLKARIPGGNTVFEVEVSDLQILPEEEEVSTNDVAEQDSVLVWVNDSTAMFNQPKIHIHGLVQIPDGKKLRIAPGQEVHFDEDGILLVNGKVEIFGSNDNEVLISADKSGMANIELDGGVFLATHTQFSEVESNLIHVRDGAVNLQKCIIADTKSDFISGSLSAITLVDCAAGNMESLGSFDRCEVKIKSFTGKNGVNFISGSGSDIEMHTSKLSGYEMVADLNFLSDFSSWSSIFENNEAIARINNVSSFKTYASSILSGENGFYIDTDAYLPGESSYLLYKTPSGNINNLEIRSFG